jgi:DNA-binding transcriptional regulator YdaS (Cro superfamily)
MTQQQKSRWNALRLRLVRATSERGGKTQLASLMGVSKQVVNAWISGAGAPNADTTLALLEWVAAAEKQQTKRAGRAQTRPALKTRKSKSTSHEKAKSGL